MVNLITNTDIKILDCLNNANKPLIKTEISFEIKTAMGVSNPRVDYLKDLRLIKNNGEGFVINNINSNNQFITELIKKFKSVLNKS